MSSNRPIPRSPRRPRLRVLAAVAAAAGLALLPGAGASADEPQAPRRFAVGLTEYHPGIVSPPGPYRPGYGRVRVASLRVAAIRPAYLRVIVQWSAVQRTRYGPINFTARGLGGQSVYAQIRAAALARARAGGAFQPVVTIYSTPSWARSHDQRCEPRGRDSRARAPTASAMPAYQRMVRSLIALGRRFHVELRYFSPWNEPNAGFFLSPQRTGCGASAPTLAPATYAMLARALRGALDADPGDQQIVLGDLSSPFARGPQITAVDEFVSALPQDVLCSGSIWAHHQYVGDADRIAQLEAALDARPCPDQPPKRIWITETGVGSLGHRRRNERPDVLRAGCRSLHGLLMRFYADPRIDAAFQYTYRQDPNFQVGLQDTFLLRLYPAYWLWRVWGGARSPYAPPPALPGQCA